MSSLDTLSALANIVKMLHTTARYYYTTEHMTNLFANITNDNITNCKDQCDFRFDFAFYDQRLAANILVKLAVKELRHRREQYRAPKETLLTPPKGNQFDFNETLIFEFSYLFCQRVTKLLDIFQTIHQLTSLSQRQLDDMAPLVRSIPQESQIKLHDFLDIHNKRFDRDYVELNVHISDLDNNLRQFINQSFEPIASNESSLKLLNNFQSILQRDFLTDILAFLTHVGVTLILLMLLHATGLLWAGLLWAGCYIYSDGTFSRSKYAKCPEKHTSAHCLLRVRAGTSDDQRVGDGPAPVVLGLPGPQPEAEAPPEVEVTILEEAPLEPAAPQAAGQEEEAAVAVGAVDVGGVIDDIVSKVARGEAAGGAVGGPAGSASHAHRSSEFSKRTYAGLGTLPVAYRFISKVHCFRDRVPTLEDLNVIPRCQFALAAPSAVSWKDGLLPGLMTTLGSWIATVLFALAIRVPSAGPSLILRSLGTFIGALIATADLDIVFAVVLHGCALPRLQALPLLPAILCPIGWWIPIGVTDDGDTVYPGLLSGPYVVFVCALVIWIVVRLKDSKLPIWKVLAYATPIYATISVVFAVGIFHSLVLAPLLPTMASVLLPLLISTGEMVLEFVMSKLWEYCLWPDIEACTNNTGVLWRGGDLSLMFDLQISLVHQQAESARLAIILVGALAIIEDSTSPVMTFASGYIINCVGRLQWPTWLYFRLCQFPVCGKPADGEVLSETAKLALPNLIQRAMLMAKYSVGYFRYFGFLLLVLVRWTVIGDFAIAIWYDKSVTVVVVIVAAFVFEALEDLTVDNIQQVGPHPVLR